MANSKFLIVTALLGLAVTSVAAADQRASTGSDVPPAVSSAIAKQYPDGQHIQVAKQVGRGVTVYAVKLAVAGAATKLCVAPSGNIQLEEQAIAPASLPEPVRKSLLASGFEPTKVVAAQRVVHSNHSALPRYDILISFQGTEHAVSFDGLGELVLEQREASCLTEPGSKADRIAESARPASLSARG